MASIDQYLWVLLPGSLAVSDILDMNGYEPLLENGPLALRILSMHLLFDFNESEGRIADHNHKRP